MQPRGKKSRRVSSWAIWRVRVPASGRRAILLPALLGLSVLTGVGALLAPAAGAPAAMEEFPIPAGSGPHDVAPARDGGIWYTAQRSGELGHFDPATRRTRPIKLGDGAAPHGVIVGPDGAPWIYGRLVPSSGRMEVFDAPRGRGPYGITATPAGDVYYASLAGNHLARVDPSTGAATVIEPPTAGQGARRVWADSTGRIWVSEWNAGQVGLYDPESRRWREWKLPGPNPSAYAVYVDERDIVWLSDFGGNAMVRFDPSTERFDVYPIASRPGNVRQIHGRPGEVWGGLSAVDRLLVIRTR